MHKPTTAQSRRNGIRRSTFLTIMLWRDPYSIDLVPAWAVTNLSFGIENSLAYRRHSRCLLRIRWFKVAKTNFDHTKTRRYQYLTGAMPLISYLYRSIVETWCWYSWSENLYIIKTHTQQKQSRTMESCGLKAMYSSTIRATRAQIMTQLRTYHGFSSRSLSHHTTTWLYAQASRSVLCSNTVVQTFL